MTTIFPFKNRTAALSVQISKNDIAKWIEFEEGKATDAVNAGIRYYMEEIFLPFAQEVHPWQHQTETLKHGHYVARSRERSGRFGMGWELVADPYRNPQPYKTGPHAGELKVVKEDYAWILEHDPTYEWLYNDYLATYHQMMDEVKSRLDAKGVNYRVR